MAGVWGKCVMEEDGDKPSADYRRRVLRGIFGCSETTVGEIMIPSIRAVSPTPGMISEVYLRTGK